ncbi:VNG_1110C family protein [Haloplanus sp. C73]|uniref:VNG_1110C family protein n=1 Tax=Haloplanus sp. C73 TaxID=3421641 RepID=UPI003EBFB0CB
MPTPERLRDSTQIVVPCESLAGLRDDLESDFAVTVFADGESTCRIIGSPTEIKAAGQFLARHGVNVA